MDVLKELPINQIICGDTYKILSMFPEESIDMIMFSPPYYGLRDYQVEGQIGLEEHPSQYIERMIELGNLLYRILKKTGSMYIVIGDTYCGSGMGTWRKNEPVGKQVYSLPFGKAVSAKVKNYKRKCLFGIPWRVALAYISNGWILRNDILWNKPNAMPSSAKDKYTPSHEYIFFFTKSPKYYFDMDAVREPHKESSIKRYLTQTQSPKPIKEIWKKNDPKQWFHRLAKAHKIRGKIVIEDQVVQKCLEAGLNPDDICPVCNRKYRRHSGKFCSIKGKHPRDVWSIPTKGYLGKKTTKHIAIYPEKLCLKPIKASCPKYVCNKCGKPRFPITKSHAIKDFNITPEEEKEAIDKGFTNHSASRLRTGLDKKPAFAKVYRGELIGWTDCKCNAGFSPGIVLDPMCGSGTTCVVAKKLGRRYIGIDINEEYCNIARDRLSKINERIDKYI